MQKIFISILLLISTSLFITGCSKNKPEIKKSYERSNANIQKEKESYKDLANELKKNNKL